jgi:hypothetical protein
MRLTLDVKLRALVKETKTTGPGTSTGNVAEGTGKNPRVNVGGISSPGSVVTTRELCLVTTLSLSLLDG